MPWWLWTLLLGLIVTLTSGRFGELRWRVLAFVAMCVALGVAGPPDPWPLLIAAATYLLVVFPVLWKAERERRSERGR